MNTDYTIRVRKWCADHTYICSRCGKHYCPDVRDIGAVVMRRQVSVASTTCPHCTAYQILKAPIVREMRLTALHI